MQLSDLQKAFSVAYKFSQIAPTNEERAHHRIVAHLIWKACGNRILTSSAGSSADSSSVGSPQAQREGDGDGNSGAAPAATEPVSTNADGWGHDFRASLLRAVKAGEDA